MFLLHGDLIEQKNNEFLIKTDVVYGQDERLCGILYVYIPKGKQIDEHCFEAYESEKYKKTSYFLCDDFKILNDKYWNKYQELYDIELW